MEEELRNCKHYGPITTTTTTTTTTAPSTQTVIVLYPSPLLYKTIFSSPSRFVSCRLDRDRLPICASEKTFFSFSYSSHPLTHSFTPCFISTTPAGHAFQPHQPLHFLSTHDISIHPSSVDSPFRLHTLEDSTPLLTHSLTHSLTVPSAPSVFCCRCHCLPLCAADLRHEPARRRDKKHSTPNSR